MRASRNSPTAARTFLRTALRLWIIVAVVMAWALLVVAPASAATSTLTAVSDKANTGTYRWTGNGDDTNVCSGYSNMWSCVDEPASAPSDDDYVSAGAGGTLDLNLNSRSVASATALTLNFRMMTGAGTTPCTLTSSVKKADGTTLATTNPTPLGSYADYSASSGALTLSQSDVDGLYVELAPTGSCVVRVSSVSVSLTYSAPAGTISGNVSDTSLCNGSTPVIGIAINGAYKTTVPCAGSKDGYYSYASTWAANQVITTYYDGVAVKGASYTRTGATQVTPVTNADVRSNAMSFGSLSASPVTAADVNVFDGGNDPDIPVNYSGSGALSTGTTEMAVNIGTFAPGVDVTTARMYVYSGATLSGGSTQLALTAAGKDGCYSGSSRTRPFCPIGTFSAGTSTVSYQATGTTTLIKPTAYYRLDIQGSATYYLGYPFDTDTGPFTMTTFTMSGSAYALGFSSSSLSISGAMTINGSANFSGGSTTSITVGGDVTGAGRITGGSFVLRAGSQQTINATGNAWNFDSLTLSSSATRNVVIASTSKSIGVSSTFQLGVATDTATTTLVTTGYTQPITTANFVNTSKGAWNASGTTLVMSGNFTNDGSITGGGTVRFSGGGTSTYTNNATAAHSSFEVTGGRTVLLATPFTANTSVTLTGAGGCGAQATLKSSVAGTQRHPLVTGATITATKAIFKDIAWAPTTFTATNSEDLGNNTGITFTGALPACVGPSNFFEHNTDARFGTAQNTAINAHTAFHMSFLNNAGAVDHYRTEITTTPLDTSVAALYALDGTGADRSATNNAMTASGGLTYAASATGFGQAASFDGVDDLLTAPTNAAYNSTSFTVEAWIRTSGYGPAAWPTIVSHSSASAMHFQLGFNKPNETLVADVTANGGSLFEISTPAAPWLDANWHHIAFTVDAARTMNLYVDGYQYATGSYSGTLDVPSAPLMIGGSNGYASNAFQGQIDDVQLSNVAKSAPDISGYARTRLPHAQSIWQSANFATTGDTLSPSCNYGTRCTDVVYGGPALQDGAHYYATHQLYTTAGVWTPATSDWFNTSDSLSVTVPSSISFSPAMQNSTVTTQFDVDMTCNDDSACSLQLAAPSASVALMNADGHHFTPPYTPGTPSQWATGGAEALGFTVLSATDDFMMTGKDTAAWGAGSDFSDLSALNFVGATPTPTVLYTSQGMFGSYPSSNSVTVGARLDTGTLAAGTYTGFVTLIAVDQP